MEILNTAAQNLLLRNEQPIVESNLSEQNHHVYINAAISQNTRKAYRHDLQHFIAWGGLLPSTPDSIVRYLHEHATILNSRTLMRRLTALKNWHLCQGFSDQGIRKKRVKKPKICG